MLVLKRTFFGLACVLAISLLFTPRAYAEQLKALINTKHLLQQQSNHDPAHSVIEQWFVQNRDSHLSHDVNDQQNYDSQDNYQAQ